MLCRHCSVGRWPRRSRTRTQRAWPLPLKPRYGIAEWFGMPFDLLSPARRRELAGAALGEKGNAPKCPFQSGDRQCAPKRPESAPSGLAAALSPLPVRRGSTKATSCPGGSPGLLGFGMSFSPAKCRLCDQQTLNARPVGSTLWYRRTATRRAGSGWKCKPSFSKAMLWGRNSKFC